MPETETPEVDDRRADLAAAMERLEKPTEAAPEPAQATQAQGEAPAPEKTAEAPSWRARDDKGRFVPATEGSKAPPPEKPSVAGAQEGVAPPPVAIGHKPPAQTVTAPPAPSFDLKPPQSWKPEIRELASKLPAEFRPILEESVRRDRETSLAIQKATTTSQQLEPLVQTIRPFAQALQQRGLNVETVVGNMLRTEQSLSHTDERVRAQVFAQALSTYRVSVEALAAALDSTPLPIQGPQAQTLDPMAIARQVKEELTREMGQQSIDRELQAFAPKAEFFEDVRPAVAAMLQSHADAGVDLSLQEAYDRACWSDPRIRGIFQQREASKKAATQVEATQRAHAASSSVKSNPGGTLKNGAPLGGERIDDLRAAAERLEWKG